MDVHVGGGVSFRREDFRLQAEFLHQESQDPHIQFPERTRMCVEDGEQRVPVVFEPGRGTVGGVDAALRLQHPGRRIIHLDPADRQVERPVPVLHREIDVLRAAGRQDPAAVPPGLFLVVLAGLHINGRILCEQRKVFYGREICDGQDGSHYSMPTLAPISMPRTMPRLEARMNSRMLSRSSDCGNPASTLLQASALFSPWK